MLPPSEHSSKCCTPQPGAGSPNPVRTRTRPALQDLLQQSSALATARRRAKHGIAPLPSLPSMASLAADDATPRAGREKITGRPVWFRYQLFDGAAPPPEGTVPEGSGPKAPPALVPPGGNHGGAHPSSPRARGLPALARTPGRTPPQAGSPATQPAVDINPDAGKVVIDLFFEAAWEEAEGQDPWDPQISFVDEDEFAEPDDLPTGSGSSIAEREATWAGAREVRARRARRGGLRTAGSVRGQMRGPESWPPPPARL